MVGCLKVGRLGLRVDADENSTDGMLRIEYGYVNRPREGSDETATAPTFHTRHISFPVLFTVYHTLECHSLDLVRLTPGGVGTGHPGLTTGGIEEGLRGLILDDVGDGGAEQDRAGGTDICLAVVSVRNIYGVPFEVTLKAKSDSTETNGTQLS
jgi:hypothetical protein